MSQRISKAAGIFLIVAGFCCLWFLRNVNPTARLFAASLGMIWVIKIAALLWQREKFHSALGFLLWITTWPGMMVTGFTSRSTTLSVNVASKFLESWICLCTGAIGVVALSLYGHGESLTLNYLALFCVMLTLHLGVLEVMADAYRLLGFSVPSIFDRPWMANSLRDFWSLRWNRAFVDMNKIFLLRPLNGVVPARVLIFSIFLVSGILHELAISFPDGSSWGKPLLYFFLQGIGMELEKKWKFPRPVVWMWVVGPVFLLFTPAFVALFMGALAKELILWESKLSLPLLLRIGGAMHLLVLCASVQVPGKLGWKEEFQKLRTLNRKVFWTYGAYIFSIIVLMACVSFVLSTTDIHVVAAKLWIGFIALFWWARVLTDSLYFRHEDWPQGPLFTIGHICLTTLFLTMALLYTAIIFS